MRAKILLISAFLLAAAASAEAWEQPSWMKKVKKAVDTVDKYTGGSESSSNYRSRSNYSSYRNNCSRDNCGSRRLGNISSKDFEIDEVLDFDTSVFKEKIKEKLPDLPELRSKSKSYSTEKIYDSLESLIEKEADLKRLREAATSIEEIRDLDYKIKCISRRIKKLKEEQLGKTQSFEDKLKELNLGLK